MTVMRFIWKKVDPDQLDKASQSTFSTHVNSASGWTRINSPTQFTP